MKTVFLCVILAAWPVGAAEHRVVAERYWHTFSAAHPVLLTVKPGDRIVTKGSTSESGSGSAAVDFEAERGRSDGKSIARHSAH